MAYHGFDIESFQVGRDLWHARIRRADLKPVMIDGLSFPALELGFAWPSADAAISDAMSHIDHFGQRYIAAAPQVARSPLKH